MEIIYLDNKQINLKTPLVCTIGAFDGIHEAHQLLIKDCIDKAHEMEAKSAVITFDPHPDYVLGKRPNEGLITPLKEKCAILEALGEDYTLIVHFTKDIAALLPEQFRKTILGHLNISHIFVGSDFRYGYKGQGDAASLNDIAPTTVVSLLTYHQNKMGSDLVRQGLKEGDLKTVREILNRAYTISGTVIEGRHIGHSLGYPTANICLKDEYLNIRKGVYAVWVYFDQHKYLGVANVGHNPTLNYKDILTLEVHILDFDQDIYGQTITVEFVEFIRGEKKFNSKNELIDEINKNAQEARQLLKEAI